jgi:diacylglycerol kinase (ATP)
VDHKTTLILNPAAGNGTAGTNFPAIQDRLAAHGFKYDLLRTTGPRDAIRMAREAAEMGAELVVAVGGDGTINEVINGLVLAKKNGKPRPALGVIPIGRGNDFAFGMNIMGDVEDAIDDLVKGERRTIDIGRVTGGDYPEGRYFGNGVGMGFDTVVGFEAAKIKWIQGAGSYLVALVQTMFRYSKFPIYEIILDDGETIRQSFMMISVMNGRRMGGAFYMAPDGNPGDGSFDLCLVNEVSKASVLLIAAKMMKGTQKEHAQVRMLQARKVVIRTVSGTIPAHADGETLCTAGHDLMIEFCPIQLDVITRSL